MFGPAISEPAVSPRLLPSNDKSCDIDRPEAGNNVGPYSWPSRYFRRQAVSLEWENFPWIRRKEAVNSPEDDMSYFFRVDENSEQDRYRIESVVDICHGVTLEELRDGAERCPEAKVALLIEGCIKNDQAKVQTLAWVIVLEGTTRGTPQRDHWSILSLVGSSPESLARQLCDFIFRYACSRAVIGISFATDGPRTFSLEFSFPLRVWRSTKTLMLDKRIKRSDGESMRSSTDVTYFRDLAGTNLDPDTVDGVYASQISCLVSGYDQWRWTALMLIETWFEEVDDDPSRDMVSSYANDMEDGMLLDPFSQGRDDMAKSLLFPRYHFLRTMQVRLTQCKDEWENIFSKVQRAIKGATKKHNAYLAEMQSATTASPLPTDRYLRFNDAEISIISMKSSLREWVTDIQETVDMGEIFMNTDVGYFLANDRHPGNGEDCFPHLTHIRKTFKELRQLQLRFERTISLCDKILEDCEVARKAFLLNSQLADTKRPDAPQAPPCAPGHFSALTIMTWMVIVSQPVVLTATIFSADGIITFERNWQNFIFTLICISAVFVLPILPWLAWRLFCWLRGRSEKPKESQGCLVDGDKEIAREAESTDQQLVPRKPTMCTKIMGSMAARNRNPGLTPRAELLEKHGDVKKPPSASTREPREPPGPCQALPQMSSEDLTTALELAGGNHSAVASVK
ncbi:hypothetical protein CPLU01_09454 [Colletotrichum plurivorum]|uniref:Uncharacterized protein n=1 Tax=Colletotrichum plurivorum TaxID=2175906 RepID=A0A8H6NBT3_9PEZI|nr:hypothetical protein CPLU01_09454 [Colletotrichum plurivorum]